MRKKLLGLAVALIGLGMLSGCGCGGCIMGTVGSAVDMVTSASDVYQIKPQHQTPALPVPRANKLQTARRIPSTTPM